MIDFDEELKNFTPVPEVSQADADLFRDDLKDITDIVLQMTEDLRREPEEEPEETYEEQETGEDSDTEDDGNGSKA